MLKLNELKRRFTIVSVLLALLTGAFPLLGLRYEAPLAVFLSVTGITVVFWMKVADATRARRIARGQLG